MVRGHGEAVDRAPDDGLRRPKEQSGWESTSPGRSRRSARTSRSSARATTSRGESGAFAEYVCVREERAVVRKPANVSFEEAAAVPIAGLTALQGLRDKGRLERGQNVLVNGASGGVGTFAVQIAKALGAHVTAVCSSGNVDAARSLGADRVIDYTKEDFTRTGERYDLLLDIAGSRSWSDCKRVLGRGRRSSPSAGRESNRLLGPLGHVVRLRLGSLRSSQKVAFFIAKFNKPDLDTLRGAARGREDHPGDRQRLSARRHRGGAAAHGHRAPRRQDRSHDLTHSPATMALELYMVGVVVEDMPRAVEFYRRLGVAVPDGAEAQEHVEVAMSGLTFFLSTKQANARWDPARADAAGGYRIVLEFYLEGREALDAKYDELTGLGYASHCAPYDVTPELRFAMVDDPDGNTILLSASGESPT